MSMAADHWPEKSPPVCRQSSLLKVPHSLDNQSLVCSLRFAQDNSQSVSVYGVASVQGLGSSTID